MSTFSHNTLGEYRDYREAVENVNARSSDQAMAELQVLMGGGSSDSSPEPVEATVDETGTELSIPADPATPPAPLPIKKISDDITIVPDANDKIVDTTGTPIDSAETAPDAVTPDLIKSAATYTSKSKINTVEIEDDVYEKSQLNNGAEEEDSFWDNPAVKHSLYALEFFGSKIGAPSEGILGALAFDEYEDPPDTTNMSGEEAATAVGAWQLKSQTDMFDAGGKVGKQSLLAAYGEEAPFAGLDLAKHFISDIHPNYQMTAGVLASVLIDPFNVKAASLVPRMIRDRQTGAIAAVLKRGIDAKSLDGTLQTGKGDGIAATGIKTLLDDPLIKFDPATLGKIGKLVDDIDAGDIEAARKLSIVLDSNPVTKQALDSALVDDSLAIIYKDLGNPEGAPFAIKPRSGGENILDVKNIADNSTSLLSNFNFAKINKIEDVDSLLLEIDKTIGKRYDAVVATMSKQQVTEMEELQRKSLDMLLATPAKKSFGISSKFRAPSSRHLTPKQVFGYRQAILAQETRLRQLSHTMELGSTSKETKMVFDKGIAILLLTQRGATGTQSPFSKILDPHTVVSATRAERFERLTKIADSPTMDDQVRRVLVEQFKGSKDPGVMSRTLQEMDKRKGAFARYFDTMHEIFSNNLLSKLTVHGTNILSNSFNLVYAPSLTAMEGVMSFVAGDFRKAFEDGADVVGQVVGIAGSASDILAIAAKKVSRGRIGKSLDDMNIPRGKLTGHHEADEYRRNKRVTDENLGATGVIGTMVNVGGKAVRVPGTALILEDMAFKLAHVRRRKSGSAMREAATHPGSTQDKRVLYEKRMTDPLEETMDVAVKEARHFTFTEELGVVPKAVIGALKKLPGFRFIFPYTQTPTNIMMQVYRNLLPGAIIHDLAPAIPGMGSYTKAERATARARMALATGASFAIASQMGDYVSGATDTTTPAGRFKEKHGIPSIAIKFDDEWLSFKNIAPWGPVLTSFRTAADIFNSIPAIDPKTGKLNELYARAGLASWLTLWNTINDVYILGSMGQMTETLRAAANGDFRQISSFMARVGGNLVPLTGMVSNLNTDDIKRRPENIHKETWITDFATNMMDGVKAQIPGLSPTLAADHTVWGDERHYDHGYGPDFASPVKTRGVDLDPTDLKLIELGINVPEQEKRMTIEGINLPLTSHQGARHAVIRGKELRGKLKNSVKGFMGLDVIQKLPPDIQKIEIEAFFAAKTAQANIQLWQEDRDVRAKWDKIRVHQEQQLMRAKSGASQ